MRKEIDVRIKVIEDYFKSIENIDELIGNFEKEFIFVFREINEILLKFLELRGEFGGFEKELKEFEKIVEEFVKVRVELKSEEGNLRELEVKKSGI